MQRFVLAVVLILLVTSGAVQSAKAATVKCKKEAEPVALAETRRKGNLPSELLALAHPTEMDGDDVVVCIGARASYNYFKLQFDAQCQLVKIEDVEYTD